MGVEDIVQGLGRDNSLERPRERVPGPNLIILQPLTNVTIVVTSHETQVKIVHVLNNGDGLSSWVALAYQVASVFDKWWSPT